jgi:hypothetical protein
MPVHTSAKGFSAPVVVVVSPTAVHAVIELHDTPFRVLAWAPPGFGVDWIRHAMPFHSSARVTWIPELVAKYPTAMQNLGEAHDTADRPLPWVSCAVFCIFQEVPLQPSANVTETPERLTSYPTAAQARVEVHDTPFR